jgi:hypothetical protein
MNGTYVPDLIARRDRLESQFLERDTQGTCQAAAHHCAR